MALRYHGCKVPLAEIRESLGISINGASAKSISDAAGRFGLRTRALVCELEDLNQLPSSAILHWEFNHFVVFERISSRGVHIVDPARGRRCLSLAEVGKRFTGVAIALEPNESFLKRRDDKNLIRAFLRDLLRSSGGVGKIFCVSLLVQVFAMAVPVLTGLIVDRVVPLSDVSLLAVVGLGMGVVVVFNTLSNVVRSYLLLQMRTNLDARMTLGFVQYLVHLPYTFFQRRSTGDLMERVASNRVIRELLTSQTLSALIDGVLVILYLVVILAADVGMAAIAVSIAAVQVAVLLFSRGRIQELEAKTLEVGARSQNYLVQMLAGIGTLKTSGAESRAVERWSHDLADALNVEVETGKVNTWIQAILGAITMAAPMIILSFGAVRVIDGGMTLGTMLATNALAAAFLTPVSNLVESALSLQRVRGHLERIDDVFAEPVEQDPADGQVLRELRGKIELRNVSFSYTRDGPAATRNASLTIEPGACVALVGASGAGKTTIAGLLAGLYRPQGGQILFDDKDLRALNLQSLRSFVGVVPQEPYFFDSSIRDNICLADRGASIERVIAAAKTAVIHEDIVALPMGYETPLADRGQSLSGGQRQRLALARALVARPSILLLDEATSALDTETEAKVVRNLNALRITRLVIAHRLSTVREADLIVVVDDGEITEAGTHSELVQNGGRYAALIQAQVRRDESFSDFGERDDTVVT